MEIKCFDFINHVIYRNSFGCDLCRMMGWKCPFNQKIDRDQDPDGTICQGFLRENISSALKKELGIDRK